MDKAADGGDDDADANSTNHTDIHRLRDIGDPMINLISSCIDKFRKRRTKLANYIITTVFEEQLLTKPVQWVY